MGQLRTSVIVDLIDRLTGPIKRTVAAVDNLSAHTQRATGRMNALESVRGIAGSVTSGITGTTGAVMGLGAGIAKWGSIATATIGAVGFGFNRLFVGTAAAFEKYRTQLEVLEGSSDKAQQAMNWVSKFATDTPFEIDGVMQSFVKLRAFGMDPMNGTMQAIADQTAKLGGGQVEMEGIVLALGQAWTKQKLQGEEALQLIERGVPVWDLLSKATGKTTAELQKMSESGQLGKHAISLLIEQMAKSSAGAANKQMQTWNGMMSNLSDAWQRFANLVADAGMFDALKQRLAGFLSTLDRMAASGELKVIAKQVSDSVLGVLDAIGALGRGIGQVFSAIAPVWRAVLSPIGSVHDAITTVTAGLTAYLTVAAPYFKGLVLTLWAVAKVVAAIAVMIGQVLVGAVKALMTVLSPVVAVFELLGKLVNAVFERIDRFTGSGIMDFLGKATASLLAGWGNEEAGKAIITNDGAKFAPNAPVDSAAGHAGERGAGKTDVGGTVRVVIDQQGKASVGSIKPNNPAVDYEIDRGLMMAH